MSDLRAASTPQSYDYLEELGRMDPRNTGQHPFARPPSQPSTRDPRHAPIPPPPYLLQAPSNRTQASFSSDPFLPRRPERDDSRREPPRSSTQGPFSISSSYGSSLSRELLGAATDIAGRQRNNSGSWIRNGDVKVGNHRPSQMEGETQCFKAHHLARHTILYIWSCACPLSISPNHHFSRAYHLHHTLLISRISDHSVFISIFKIYDAHYYCFLVFLNASIQHCLFARRMRQMINRGEKCAPRLQGTICRTLCHLFNSKIILYIGIWMIFYIGYDGVSRSA